MSFHRNSSKDTLLNFMLKRPTTEVVELAERFNEHELIECEVRTKGKKNEIVKDIGKKVSRGLIADEMLDMYEFDGDDDDEETDDSEADEDVDDDECEECDEDEE